jgi:rod shape-determining protein MreC
VRNFILFIRRFFNLILFIGVEIVCIVLIARTNTMQGNEITSSANTVTGLMYKKQNDVVYYFGLGAMNDSLVNENARLRTQMSLYRNADTLKDIQVKRLIGADTATHVVQYADYVYRTARVINNSISLADNYITINRGANDGIAANMAVISGSGIVGRVAHVSAHYASILSVLSTHRLSAKLKDGTYGYTVWDNENPDILVMRDVQQQIKVKVGDSVFTTTYSFFPPDIVMGTIVKVTPKGDKQLLLLKPTTNFRNLQYVYVVEDKMAGERRQLEDSVKIKK